MDWSEKIMTLSKGIVFRTGKYEKDRIRDGEVQGEVPDQYSMSYSRVSVEGPCTASSIVNKQQKLSDGWVNPLSASAHIA